MFKVAQFSPKLNIPAKLNAEQARIINLKVIVADANPNRKLCIGVIVKENNNIIALRAKEIVTPETIKKNEFLAVDFLVIFPSDASKPSTLVIESEAHYL